MSRNTCQNCGAMVESPKRGTRAYRRRRALTIAPEPIVEPVDLGMSLDVPSSRKPLALVALLWAAARPGGVSRTDASRIVAPELDPDGPSGLRKLRRYVSDIRSLGLVVEQHVDPLIGHPGARVLSYAVMGVDFRIWRMR